MGLYHSHRLFDIDLNGKKQKLLVKELQYDHLRKKVIHADFVRVDLSEKVKVSVPVEMKGTAKGAHEGGFVEQHVSTLEVECLVTDIPEKITVSVKDIGIGDTIHVRDIVMPAGVKLVSDPTLLVVTCQMVAAAIATEEVAAVEAPTEPEVIREKKEKEAEETEAE